jgi:phosphoserine phosphatase
MKYKDYSDEIWRQIHTSLDQALLADSEPIAAFDADGTLWDTDLGENFFHHQINNKLVPLPASPWQHYQDLKAAHPPTAYLWLAQICKGEKLDTVHQWAREALKEYSQLPVFSEQKKLIELFLKRGVKVYVITASVKWAVEPGAKALGLSYDSVIGVETEVQQNLITDKQNGFISYRQGKVDALLAKTGGKKPFFASGNTMGDYQLLQSATGLSLAVSAATESSKLFATETDLAEAAQKHGWLHHRFI